MDIEEVKQEFENWFKNISPDILGNIFDGGMSDEELKTLLFVCFFEGYTLGVESSHPFKDYY